MKFAMFAAAIGLLCATAPVRAEGANATIQAGIDGFVKPGYTALHDATDGLQATAEALCKAPGEAELEATRDAFDATVAAWSRIEIVRIGPVSEDNRLERILFWPDRKGIGLKQVQAALATRDGSTTSLDGLTQKSVAVQALGALEFVLFGTGSDMLIAGDKHRCAFGRTIAQNLDTIAGAVLAAWDAPDGFSHMWAHPSADNPFYRDDTEALNDLLAVFVNELELVRDQRLNGFFGETPADDKEKQAVFWRSGNTATTLKDNVEGMKALFHETGLGKTLAGEDVKIVESIEEQFDRAINAAARVTSPIDEALADPGQRASLTEFGAATSALSDLFGNQLSAKLGLTAGFSSLDGD
jgi:predicted lipoprotein